MEIKDFFFASDSTPPLSVIAAAKVASLTLPPPTAAAADSASLPAFVFSNGYPFLLLFFLYSPSSLFILSYITPLLPFYLFLSLIAFWTILFV